jgi:hypothetical protein
MKKLLPFALVIFIFFSCKKETKKPAVTVPVVFTATTYQNLGTFDDSGKPLKLETSDVISANFLNFLHASLPERVNLNIAHPELLSSSAIGDIKITQPTELHMTFLSQGTIYKNAVGFYTYPTNSPPATAADIKTIIYIFPNTGGGTTLKAGDKVSFGTFQAGTSVGFVLMKDAWKPDTKTLSNDVVHFCSNDVLNPEVAANLKKHAVLIEYAAESKTILGFEDMDRTDPNCDNDFNDAVFYVTKTLK